MTLDSIKAEFLRYKTLAEAAVSQVSDEDLNKTLADSGNSISTLMRHMSGNLKSRYTDFLVSGIDGEKPWRKREEEFEEVQLSRDELFETWREANSLLERVLSKLSNEDFPQRVKIRGVELRVDAALHRSLAHYTYHVGQIILLARFLVGEKWETLTVLSGTPGSESNDPDRDKLTRW